MVEVMFPSQLQQNVLRIKQITPEREDALNNAAFDCITSDGLSFDDFRKSGMQKFLNVICPG